jgi:outer membrane protein OmpA-like peptidoglycan-associated protein
MKLNKLLVLTTVLTVAACNSAGNSTPYSRYGYEAKMDSQNEYFRSLGSDNYITQDDSWDEKLDVRKDHFHNILKREYLEFATNLEKDRDYTDSSFFRRKGLDAERGDFDIFPEDPAKWNVKNDNDLEELRVARLGLIDSLIGYTPIADPIAAARAIVYYDCWVQQSQMKKAQFNKENCKQYFKTNEQKIAGISKDIRDKDVISLNEKYKWVEVEKPKPPVVPVAAKKPDATKAAPAVTAAAVKKTDAAAKAAGATSSTEVTKVKPSMAYTPAPKAGEVAAAKTQTTTTAKAPAAVPATGTQPANVVKEAEDKSLITDQSDNSNAELVFIAYFDKKSDALSDKAKVELDKTVEEIKTNSPKIVSVNGHTDRSLSAGESLVVSKKRADSVRDYLISKGVAKELIRTYGFGKTDNLVDNPEGEEKPANNRVEVNFKSAAK